MTIRFAYEYLQDTAGRWRMIVYANEDIRRALKLQSEAFGADSIDDYLCSFFVGNADGHVISARYDSNRNAVVITFSHSTRRYSIDGESFMLAIGEACGFERISR